MITALDIYPTLSRLKLYSLMVAAIEQEESSTKAIAKATWLLEGMQEGEQSRRYFATIDAATEKAKNQYRIAGELLGPQEFYQVPNI